MKKQRFNKKLVLNKQTVANLNMNEMTNLKGGKDTPPVTQEANGCSGTDLTEGCAATAISCN